MNKKANQKIEKESPVVKKDIYWKRNFVPVDETTRYDRSGERVFKKHTPKVIAKAIDSLSDEEIDSIYFPWKDGKESIKDPFGKIISLAISYIREDTSFQNLNSERDYAIKKANEMKENVEEILQLVNEVPEEDASICIYVINRINHFPFVRVLGDQLDRNGTTKLIEDFAHNNKNILYKKNKRFRMKNILIDENVDIRFDLEKDNVINHFKYAMKRGVNY